MKIIQVPGINGLNKTKGCKNASEAILTALESIYSNEKDKSIDKNKLKIEKIKLENNDLEKENELIYKKAFESYENNSRTFFIGGDHSISYSLTRGFFDYCENKGSEPCLIVFDAHPDCMEPVDKKFPTHEEWLRCLIEDGFNPKNILLVGVRNSWKSETKFLKEKGVRKISINNFLEDLNGTVESIMEFSYGKELYVSIDIDVIDPAYAPATYYCEPAGLTSRQFVYLISRMNKMKNLRAIDLVEINNKKDEKFGGRTIQLGAKILAEFFQ